MLHFRMRGGRQALRHLPTAAHVEVVSALRSTDFLFVADDLHPVFAETAVGYSSSGDTLFRPFEQGIRQEFVNAKILALQKFKLRMPPRESSNGRVNPLNEDARK